MIEMISRLLMEADLEGEIPKLEVYGKTIDGIKELLNFLLKDPVTGKMERYNVVRRKLGAEKIRIRDR